MLYPLLKQSRFPTSYYVTIVVTTNGYRTVTIGNSIMVT